MILSQSMAEKEKEILFVEMLVLTRGLDQCTLAFFLLFFFWMSLNFHINLKANISQHEIQ